MTSLSGLPSRDDTRLKTIVFHEVKSRGEFSTIYRGLEATSGNSTRCCKQVHIQTQEQLDRTAIECRVRSKNRARLITTVEMSDANGELTAPPTKIPTIINFVMPEWCNLQSSCIETTFSLHIFYLYDLLVGLKRIHAKGWLHANIRPEHILLLIEPPQAAFCGLSHVQFEPISYDPDIMDRGALPPEGRPSHKFEGQLAYTQKSEVWLLGETLGRAMYLDVFRDAFDHRSALTGDLDETRAYGDVRSVFHQSGDRLQQVLCEMLAWRPEDRPTASQLVEDRLFDCFRQDSKQEEK